MDLYRITRIDPRSARPEVRYGTKVRVAAMACNVREQNADRDGIKAWLDRETTRYDMSNHFGPEHWKHVELRVERAVITDWTDVSQKFIKP